MKKEKLLKKAINNPKNIRFNEFVTLVKSFGFDYDHTSGSHHFYYNDDLQITINIQSSKNSKAKSYQIKDFIDILEENNVI